MKKSYLVACLLMILGISVRTVAQTNPGTVNLKHQWTFDDGTANDNVGGVNGTLMSGATVSNNALNTTNGGWVNLDATALAINTYSELTVEAWFTSVAGANTGYHFLYYLGNTTNGGGDHFTGFTPARGDDRSRLMLSAGGSEAAINSTEFDDGRLHHMVCVINSTTLYYYIDGILLATKSIGTNTLANVGNQFAYFAKGGWTSDPTWKGTIDQISVYDKALTADNVKYLYDQHKENITPADPGIANLTHQWTFDDGTATDIVGGVNGVLNGSATVSGKALNTTNGGYVNLDAAALAVNTYSQLTVEAWFTSSTGANTGYHFLYYFGNTTNNNGNHFTGFTPARGNDFSRTMIDTGDGEKGINCTEFDDGRLHHIVCVIDATTLTYYIDGIFVGTVNIGASSLANVSAQFAYFAKGGWSNDPTWKGMIHKISMYNKALMINNVKYLYSMGPEQTPS
ncbi:MAG: LamG domain-containing protein, partial [Bacteroidota bacterium]|nr:LamG domain-containing protein [Bacteroidota bacterium]